MDYGVIGAICVLVFFVCVIAGWVANSVKRAARDEATDKKIRDLEAKVKDEKKPADKPEEKK